MWNTRDHCFRKFPPCFLCCKICTWGEGRERERERERKEEEVYNPPFPLSKQQTMWKLPLKQLHKSCTERRRKGGGSCCNSSSSSSSSMNAKTCTKNPLFLSSPLSHVAALKEDLQFDTISLRVYNAPTISKITPSYSNKSLYFLRNWILSVARWFIGIGLLQARGERRGRHCFFFLVWRCIRYFFPPSRVCGREGWATDAFSAPPPSPPHNIAHTPFSPKRNAAAAEGGEKNHARSIQRFFASFPRKRDPGRENPNYNATSHFPPSPSSSFFCTRPEKELRVKSLPRPQREGQATHNHLPHARRRRRRRRRKRFWKKGESTVCASK